MAKASGLGDALYVGGFNLSGDIQQLGRVGGGPAALDVTDITQSAVSRLGGERDGGIEFVSYFDPSAGAAHPVLSALPTTDTQVMYCRGTTLGSAAAALVGKQINYDPTRGQDGSLTIAVQAQSNGFGLEWGNLLTAGTRTDSGATNGTGIDTLASASFGGQAYLQVLSFTGTDVTVKIQDSADNISYADVATFAFAQTTSAPTTQRISISNSATIRQYIRAATVTSGGFSSVSFVCAVVKNMNAGVVF